MKSGSRSVRNVLRACLLVLAVSSWFFGTAFAQDLTGSDENISAETPLPQGFGEFNTVMSQEGEGDPSDPVVLSLPPNTFRIINAGNNWCLTPSGTVVTLTDCAFLTNSQLWYYTYIGSSGGSNYYNIVNYSTGKCVDVAGGSYADGALLTTGTCCPQCTSMWWRQQDQGPVAGMFHMRNLPSGKCMDMPVTAGTPNWSGLPMQQWSCGGTTGGGTAGFNQFWVLRSF